MAIFNPVWLVIFKTRMKCCFSVCLKFIHRELLVKTTFKLNLSKFQCHFLKMTSSDWWTFHLSWFYIIYLSHTPIYHQPRVGPCGGATTYYRKRGKKNPKVDWFWNKKFFCSTTTTRRFHVVSPSPRNFKFHITKFSHHQIFSSSNLLIIESFHYQIASIQLILGQRKHRKQVHFDELVNAFAVLKIIIERW